MTEYPRSPTQLLSLSAGAGWSSELWVVHQDCNNNNKKWAQLLLRIYLLSFIFLPLRICQEYDFRPEVWDPTSSCDRCKDTATSNFPPKIMNFSNKTPDPDASIYEAAFLSRTNGADSRSWKNLSCLLLHPLSLTWALELCWVRRKCSAVCSMIAGKTRLAKQPPRNTKPRFCPITSFSFRRAFKKCDFFNNWYFLMKKCSKVDPKMG